VDSISNLWMSQGDRPGRFPLNPALIIGHCNSVPYDSQFTLISTGQEEETFFFEMLRSFTYCNQVDCDVLRLC
jgi:hypothetical protein